MALSLVTIGTVIREKKWPIPNDSHQLICRYKYFYILASDLGVASDMKWYVSSEPEKEISQERIKELFPSKTPELSLWEHYALLLVVGAVILFGFITR